MTCCPSFPTSRFSTAELWCSLLFALVFLRTLLYFNKTARLVKRRISAEAYFLLSHPLEWAPRSYLLSRTTLYTAFMSFRLAIASLSSRCIKKIWRLPSRDHKNRTRWPESIFLWISEVCRVRKSGIAAGLSVKPTVTPLCKVIASW